MSKVSVLDAVIAGLERRSVPGSVIEHLKQHREIVEAAVLRFRVDVFCSGGWQHLASFADETDAYEYGERKLKSRVWDADTCIAANDGRRSWHGIKHNRDCDGKPCECGAAPPIGSHHGGG